MKKIIYTSSAILLASALILSCGKKEASTLPMQETSPVTSTSSAEMTNTNKPVDFPEGHFVIDMTQAPWSSLTYEPEDRPEINISAEGTFNGFAGPNNISGKAIIDTSKASLKFEEIMSTKQAGTPDAMELEKKFLEILTNTRSFEYTSSSESFGNILKLKDSKGMILAELYSAPM